MVTMKLFAAADAGLVCFQIDSEDGVMYKEQGRWMLNKCPPTFNDQKREDERSVVGL
jgi:hypothetical protein